MEKKSRRLIRLFVTIIIATFWLQASSLDLPIKTINGKDYYYYTSGENENIYKICRKLGISKNDIIKYNPSVADGMRKHITLYFPVSAFASESPSDNEPTTGYRVKDNESLYSIAQKNGMTARDIEKVNPDLSVIKKGQYIRLPDREQVKAVTETDTVDTKAANGTLPDTTIAETANDDVNRHGIDIAIMLPFMLDKENPDKKALLFTDFYKGFLIAADSLRNIGTPIHIHAYDTADSLELVQNILRGEEIKGMDMIIAPEDDIQLKTIADFGRENGCDVLNIFSVRNALYLSHGNMLHANIPHKSMYAKAIDYLMGNLGGHTPIFIVNSDGEEDKTEFINSLKSRLNHEGKYYDEIFFTSALQIEDMATLNDSTRYIFIPESGSHAELNKILPTLKAFQGESDTSGRIRLFGYPEWTTFRGETLQRMHELNTTVYSRFYNETDSHRTQRVTALFKKWYGSNMISTAPVQGILGFDTGMFVITHLHNQEIKKSVSPYNGIQSGFSFHRPDNAKGKINETLYFINFRPDGTVTKINR